MADFLINSSADLEPIESTGARPRLLQQRNAVWSSVRIWSARGVMSLVDQGLISGANFFVGIILARHLASNQYGAYALAFEIFLFLAVVYGALVLEPLSVFGSSVYKDSNREYLGALIRIHAVIAALIFLVLGACAWIMHLISPGDSIAPALIGVGIGSPFVLLFWLARRGFYLKLSSRQAAAGAFVYSGIVLGGLLIADRLGLLSPLAAFVLMGGGAAVTVPMMLARLEFSLKPKEGITQITEIIRRHWRYGRWALGSAVAIWFSSAIYYPLLGSLHGLSDA